MRNRYSREQGKHKIIWVYSSDSTLGDSNGNRNSTHNKFYWHIGVTNCKRCNESVNFFLRSIPVGLPLNLIKIENCKFFMNEEQVDAAIFRAHWNEIAHHSKGSIEKFAEKRSLLMVFVVIAEKSQPITQTFRNKWNIKVEIESFHFRCSFCAILFLYFSFPFLSRPFLSYAKSLHTIQVKIDLQRQQMFSSVSHQIRFPYMHTTINEGYAWYLPWTRKSFNHWRRWLFQSGNI